MMGPYGFDIGFSLAGFPGDGRRTAPTPPAREAQIKATRNGWSVRILEDEQKRHANIWRVIVSRTVPRLVDAIRLAERYEPKTTRVHES
jgi:hypothetical protein